MKKTLSLSKQDYTPKPKIDGVHIVPLDTFQDDGGYFLEVARFKERVFEQFPDFELKQLNISEMDPGVIKAWHIHQQQDDIWFVPPSQKLLIALHDIREQSVTKNTMMRLVCGAGKAQLVFIPRGVAHGAANLWQKPALIVYLVNSHFTADPVASDEYRLPWDHFGTEIWQQTKG